MVGAAGGCVSTTTTNGGVAGLILPAPSVTVAVSEWLPSPRAGAGVKLQLPFSSLMVVPMTAPLSRMVTIESASVTPASVGVLSLVNCPEVRIWVVPTLSVTVTIEGAFGTRVSTMIWKSPDGSPWLPAASVARAVKIWSPSPSGAVGVKLQNPLLFTVVVA